MKKVLYFFYVLSIGSCLTIKKSFESIDGNRYKFSLSESKGISEIHIENKKYFILEECCAYANCSEDYILKLESHGKIAVADYAGLRFYSRLDLDMIISK